MSTPTSQGSSVSFGNVPLGRVTSFRASGGSAVYQEVTNVTSTVLGADGDSRVVKQYTCTAVEPGIVEIGCYGAPPYVFDSRGTRGEVAVAWSGGGLSADAYLDDFEVAGQVGEFLVGTARFRLSGF